MWTERDSRASRRRASRRLRRSGGAAVPTR